MAATKLSGKLTATRNAVFKILDHSRENLLDLGYEIAQLSDEDCAKSGFQNLSDFYEQAIRSQREDAPAYPTVWEYVSIAQSWPKTVSLRYPITKLIALLAWLHVNNLPLPVDPALAKIPVVRPDGTIVDTPFSDCTREQIHEAVARIKHPPEPVPADVEAQFEQLEAAMEQVERGGKHRVRLVKERGDYAFLLRLRRSGFKKTVAALAKALPDDGSK
jgi:hypothetical protein